MPSPAHRATVLEREEKHLRFGQPRPKERSGGDPDLPIGQGPPHSPLSLCSPAAAGFATASARSSLFPSPGVAPGV
jgi:hypothetical protein